MNAWTAGALAVLAFVAWDTRRRWAPADLVGESDAAPDLVDRVLQLPDDLAESFDPTPPMPMANDNRRAFLTTIGVAEGTVRAGGYQALYGSTPARLSTFDSFDDHPAELGWRGVRLTDEQCRGAGFGPGCVSTAAGMYQIVRPTWRRVRGRAGLVDFSPASQDAAALFLIAEAGALPDIDAGRFDRAIARVRRIWASLPGANYAGQGMRSLESLRSAFVDAGGTLEA